ncbi:MAG TPA: ribosome biogenesis GTP-binding protein YihA/YsxC [Spirochaetota bacterium]|nr:YihA family ribosome biogenesis GTP-binding protein [Spirochaetota bacterium]HOD16456.1 ribosome biogenesis GTP-binding protein YihA/YsxC [Spirochaetota bacterium]HPG50221.1 ribosome biogenesis GTP-binding protein YihA/YsxC [Spirochaetota bacterium]HPN11277.1 ribosome biogenesis GTP-binding protein YihA/YsxC [Spirochaetota bacterium]
MKIREVHFLKSCSAVSQFPRYRHPEIAFFGRSNVGKSSLINMIMKKQRLVKTGSMPGVTKTVNFFLLNDSISLADLPGFGYAKLPHAMRKAFLPLIKKYIEGRGNLRLAFLLIDVRRVPDDAELEILSLLTGRGVPVAVTLTKCDKLSRNQRARSVAAIADALGVPRDAIFMSSAKSEEGRKELLGLIEEHASAGTGD